MPLDNAPEPKWNGERIRYDCPEGWESHDDFKRGTVSCVTPGTAAKAYHDAFTPERSSE
jgi:hypothetical protein